MEVQLRADLEREMENAAFLRGVIEQLQRDGAEVRAALREALKLAPKAITAGDSSTNDGAAVSGKLEQVATDGRGEARTSWDRNAGARTAQNETQPGAAGNDGPGTPNGARSEAERAKTPVSYGDIADALEAQLAREASEST